MDRIKVSGEDCYSAGAYLALDREAKCFEVALDGLIKARLWSPLFWHGITQ